MSQSMIKSLRELLDKASMPTVCTRSRKRSLPSVVFVYSPYGFRFIIHVHSMYYDVLDRNGRLTYSTQDPAKAVEAAKKIYLAGE
jgi:hypothetical protein